MIRVVLFLIFVGLLAFTAAWLADRPGDVAITWQGYRVETSVMVAAGVMMVLMGAAIMVWSIFRLIMRSPDLVAHMLWRRRRHRGEQAISRGLIAIGAGDAKAAKRFAEQAQRTVPSDPLTLLLRAQTAQLLGNRKAAEEAFRAMAARKDTKLLGYRGLYVEAQRHDDAQTARHIAEAAAKQAPSLPWAADAALQSRCAAGDWQGALAQVEANARAGLTGKAAARRQRAVLLTAQALSAEETDRDQAKGMALEAVKLAPDLVPAAALAGRLLAEAGESRKARKILEAAWKSNPHPDVADVYMHVRLADSARERLARAQHLATLRANEVESVLALARAALDAHEFSLARNTLAPLLVAPTQRVALLMAELEEREHGDEGRAREWTSRAVRAARDPVWTADGFVSDRWLPVSPVSGRLDAFEWRLPVNELEGPKPVEPKSPPLIEQPARADDGARRTQDRLLPPAAGDSKPPSEPLAPQRLMSARPAEPEPLIPLVHVPDDPGPEAEQESEAVSPSAQGWRRAKDFFRP